MTRNEFYYPSADGKTKIHAVEWLPEGEPKAILQIAHGVTEYILRYEEFAKFLTEKGIAVIGNDHIGHGTSIAEGAERMYFGPEGSWDWVVEDIKKCLEITKNKFPNTPYCLLGFSLGSFLARTYLTKYPGTLNGAIIMGSGQLPPFQISIAKFMVNNEAKKVGEDHTSPTIQKLSYETYNKYFAPNRTKYDWLCASATSLDEYIKDTMRGEDFTAGLFRELLNGMAFTAKQSNIEKIDKNMPILFLSGDKDPVGEQGKGVIKAYDCFKKAGIKDVNMKLYPGLRHDILREDCRQDIFEDIYNWMKDKIISE